MLPSNEYLRGIVAHSRMEELQRDAAEQRLARRHQRAALPTSTPAPVAVADPPLLDRLERWLTHGTVTRPPRLAVHGRGHHR